MNLYLYKTKYKPYLDKLKNKKHKVRMLGLPPFMAINFSELNKEDCLNIVHYYLENE